MNKWLKWGDYGLLALIVVYEDLGAIRMLR